MALTFKQGIHPQYKEELTWQKPLQKADRPERVIIPLQQHIGAPCKPLVEKGDHVDMGQKIGDTDSFVSAPVHASISGTVENIEEVRSPSGDKVPAVIIAADEEDKLVYDFEFPEYPENASREDIMNIIREAGITGMGGAMFPTHVKINVPEEKEIDCFILNGAECEPYLTIDERIMMERTDEIIAGMKFLMKVIDVQRGIVAIEDNKKEAIKIFKEKVAEEENIEVKVFATKYPQGGEKMLIEAVLDREVPVGGLPLDVGVVVNNVMTAAAVSDAVCKGQPLIERPICVTGEGIKNPGNYIARIGTPVKELIEQAGGFSGKPGKVIVGGPMMGVAQKDLDAPLIKGSSGIVVLPEDMTADEFTRPCIKCARCVDACPVFLMPTKLMNFVKEDMYEKAEKFQLESCIECGSCAYVCPSKIPLVHYFQLGKAELMARKRDSDD
ncbi:MAG: electron transport complex subunit RsxC [Bacillota bacterium]